MCASFFLKKALLFAQMVYHCAIFFLILLSIGISMAYIILFK
ncbi:hypothetical protein HMPREF3202_01138 [Prevotella bivia]|uniref:Uncharacterized protein n=1 Tax=Prevotella bivia TaxID=28125 RepID=A0A137SYB0_9BACT|nr:hypothetical protein HMPREF3202_01138 [Prevotella bivia]